MIKGALISQYEDNNVSNVSVFCDFIPCAKAVFYMFNIAVTFSGVGSRGRPVQAINLYPFMLVPFLTEKLTLHKPSLENGTTSPPGTFLHIHGPILLTYSRTGR